MLCARYWRRMGIVTTAEFIELRYGGKFAGIYRTIYALYSAFGWAPLVTGYMTAWTGVELQPMLGWSRAALILACGLLVLLYTVISGLFGIAYIAYNDIFQFWLYLLGAVLLVPIMLHKLGGWHHLLAMVHQQRGAGFLQAVPPTHTLTPAVLIALCLQGLLFAASPTAGEGATAQKFMAARDETHAAAGQLLSAFLSLVVRVIPFIFFGLVGAVLYRVHSVSPDLVWSRLMMRFAPPGLLGLVIASEFAGYMSVANSYMNWGGSFITNDVYCRMVKQQPDGRRLALVGKLATAGIVLLSFLVALLLVNRMMSWFLYINSVMIAFVLPLAWLRFFWWRLNIWGEAAGVLIGLPLSYLLWFPLGFSQKPFWLAFFVLFGSGWAVILLASLLTPRESHETLARFYQRCTPPGLWGPISRHFPETRRRIHNDFRRHPVRRHVQRPELFYGRRKCPRAAVSAGLADRRSLVPAILAHRGRVHRARDRRTGLRRIRRIAGAGVEPSGCRKELRSRPSPEGARRKERLSSCRLEPCLPSGRTLTMWRFCARDRCFC